MGIWLERLGAGKSLPELLWPESAWASWAALIGGGAFVFALALLWIGTGMRISLIDIREHRIPRVIVLPARRWALLLAGGLAALLGDPVILLSAAAGGIGYWFLLYALHRAHPAGLGRGDVNYASLLGIVTGATGWAHPWFSAAFAFFLGGFWSVALLLFRRAGAGTRIPFGPFMFAGSAAVLLLS